MQQKFQTPSLKQRGFTLIEVMVVVTIIAILATIGIRQYRSYVLEAYLNDALPVMQAITSKMRMHKIKTGKYCCDGDNFDEEVIADQLGVNLEQSGDFCFMIMCPTAANCTSPSPGFYITSPEQEDAAPEFEVIALLRASTTGSITSPIGQTCKPHPSKIAPSGWVATASFGTPGQEGRMLVYRYPPPKNGQDTSAGSTGDQFVWDAGFSKTNALK